MTKWTWNYSTFAVVLCIYRTCATDVTEPVIDFSCVTYNWIEYVICRWNFLKGTDIINVDVLWRPVILNSRWYNCSEPTRTSCKWNIEDGRLAIDIERKYTILVRINHDYLQQSIFHVRWNETVQPAPVSNLYVTDVGVSCITLNWEHSDYIHNKTFRISYKALTSFNEEVKAIHSDHDTIQVPICNLAIYTKYEVTVSCKTVKKGIWSIPVSTTFSTKKSRPVSPRIYEGGYAWRPTTAKKAKLTFFWQLLTKSEWNADTIYYDVQLNNAMRNTYQSSSQFFVTFEVERNSNYQMQIWSRNEIGISEQQSMKLTPYQGLDFPSEVFAVRNQTKGLQLFWRNPRNKNINYYSIFWCEHAFADICVETPSSITVSSSISQPVSIKQPDIGAFLLFGVSYTTTENVTSGFVWSDCSVDLTSAEFPYDLVVTLQALDDIIFVKWKLLKCNFLLKKLEIQMFIVKVCDDVSCKGYRELNVSGTENKTSIPKTNGKVCVQVSIQWNAKYGRPSKTECIEVEIGSDTHLKIILGIASLFIIVAAVGFCLVLRKVARTIKKVKKPFTIELPVLQNNVNAAPVVDSVLPLLETG